MKLINISNHPSNKWSDKQKEGWEAIIDIPFPAVGADLTTSEVYRLANELIGQIEDIAYKERGDIAVCIMGEYALSFLLFRELELRRIPVAVPTTERKSVEQIQPDGSVVKTSTFEFVKWRLI